MKSASTPMTAGVRTTRSHRDFIPPLVFFVPKPGTKSTNTGTKNTKPWYEK